MTSAQHPTLTTLLDHNQPPRLTTTQRTAHRRRHRRPNTHRDRTATRFRPAPAGLSCSLTVRPGPTGLTETGSALRAPPDSLALGGSTSSSIATEPTLSKQGKAQAIAWESFRRGRKRHPGVHRAILPATAKIPGGIVRRPLSRGESVHVP